MTPEDWTRLPDKSRRAVAWLLQELNRGFTGQIRLDALNGSVEEIRPTPVIRTRELGHFVVDAPEVPAVD